MIKRIVLIGLILTVPIMLLPAILVPPPILANPDVDIGAEAIDRGNYETAGRTCILKDHPATVAGEITSIDIWAVTGYDILSLEVGTFYTTNGDTLKCRDSEAIPGIITAGSKVTKVVSIAVEIGDYIGAYWTSGRMEMEFSGFAGYWEKVGRHIDPDDEEAYTFNANRTLSLGGYITPPVPTVTTQAASDVAQTTATGNGNITATTENCTERGFDWDIDSGAPYANSVTTSGNYTTGAFTGSLTSLPVGTVIYYRAKAYNIGGWGYGDEVTFNTLGPPTVTTVAATYVKKTSAQLNGNIVRVNGKNADERGLEWGTATGNYTDNWTESNSFEAGVFDHTPTLVENTTYYFRALAHNDYGWGYGSELSFETLGIALWFQPNEIIIGTTLPDRAGNNDGVITWGSNPADVSANFTSFQTTAEAKAPAYALEEAPAFIETVPEIVSTWDVTPEAGVFPLAGVVRAIAAATDTPAQLPLLIIAAFVIMACSLAISATMRRYGSGSLIVKSLVITALMGVFIAIDNFGIDFWMLFVFLVIAVALAMASRQTTWQ